MGGAAEGLPRLIRAEKRSRALRSEWGAGSARRVAEDRVGESVSHGDTHTSQAPVDDLSPAELTGACPTPTR